LLLRLSLCLTLGCAGAPDAPPPPTAPPPLRPTSAAAWHPDLELRVLSVRWEPAPDGVRAVVELTVDNVSAGAWDGVETRRRTVAVARDAISLVADGRPIAAEAVPDQAGWFGETLGVPPEGASRLRGKLAFRLPAQPARLALSVRYLTDTLTVPILGTLLAGDGQEFRALVPLGPSDLPVAATVSARVDGAWTKVPAPLPGQPWRVPAAADLARAELAGHVPWEGPLTDGATVARLRPTEGWGAAVTLPAWDRGDVALEAFADRFADPAEAAAWVRDHVAILPVNGLQHGPGAVLRAGAGGPLERAELLRAVAQRTGAKAAIVCGDLAAEQAAAVFTPPPAPAPPDGALGDAVRAVRALTDTWAGPVGQGLDLGALPPPPRERVALVPEWCWVQLFRDEGNVDLDLRPAPFTGTPLPRVWRSTARPAEDVWRVELRVIAVVRTTGPAGEPAWDTRELLLREADAPSLSERPLVLDLFDDGAGQLTPRMTLLDARAAAAAAGEPVAVASLDRLLLDVRWIDPADVESGQRELALWDALPGAAPPRALRAVLTGDSGVTTTAPLAARLDAAFSDRYPPSGARAVAAEHDLYRLLLHHAWAGQTTSSPPLRVTLFSADADGLITRRFDEVAAPGPATAGPTLDRAARVRLGVAAHATARLVEGLGHAAPPLLPPTVAWSTTPEAFAGLPFRGPEAQMRARRHLGPPGSAVGVDEQGEPWFADGVTGGIASLPSARPLPERLSWTDPAQLHAAWDIPLLCGAARRLGAALGVGKLPTVCQGPE
jgi:hypothetical protein